MFVYNRDHKQWLLGLKQVTLINVINLLGHLKTRLNNDKYNNSPNSF